MVDQIILAALELGNGIVDLIPNYDERKKNRWHKLRKEYVEEFLKADHDIDPDKLVRLEYELLGYLSAFSSSLQREGVLRMHKKDD